MNGFAGELRVEQLVEEGDDLLAVHRPVEVRRDRRDIDPLAKIVVAALLEPLKEDGDAFFGSGPPVLRRSVPRDRTAARSPLSGERRSSAASAVRLGRRWIEEGNEGVFDIVAVEIAWNRTSEPGEGCADVIGQPLVPCVCVCRDGYQRGDFGAGQHGSSIYLGSLTDHASPPRISSPLRAGPSSR